MTLYEINKQIEETIYRMFSEVDEETGEVSQGTVDLLEELNIAKDEKLENIGCLIKNLNAEIEALKAEEKNLADRRKRIENKVKRLTEYIEFILHGEDWDKSPRVAFRYKPSKAVKIIDLEKIPKMFRRVKWEPDKTAIKKAIAEGKKVRGAEIEEKNNLRII